MLAEHCGIGSVSDLKRKFEENAAYAAWCGFEGRLPSRSTLSRFRTRLALLRKLMMPARRRMLLELMGWELSFGEELAIDCTFVPAWSNGRRKPHSDPDARFGHSTKNRGRMKTELDLGYKMHMVVCALIGVPLSVITTPADVPEAKMLRPQLELTRAMAPALRLRSISADKGYDSRANTEAVIAAGADPVMDIRNLPGGKPATGAGGILMNREGTPFCPDCAEPMVFAGHAGSGPREQQSQVWDCPVACGGAPVRVRWAGDPRRTPYWPRAAARTRKRKAAHQAVERSNSTLKTVGSFITGHRARGIDRISFLGEFATLMMQARALAAYRDGRPDDLRKKTIPVN